MSGWELAVVALAVAAVSAWMNRMLQEAKRTNELLTRMADHMYYRDRT